MRQIPAGRLRKVILLYSVLVMLLLSAVVAVVAVVPLHRSLKAAADAELRHALDLRLLAVEQYAARVFGLASQVASRTMIRRKLAELNRGAADREEASAYIAEKLADALRQAPEALGMVRLAADGQPVARLGVPLPETVWGALPAPGPEPVIHGVVRSQGVDGLLVSAPILDRKGVREGIDVLLLRLEPLMEAISGVPVATLFLARLESGTLALSAAGPEREHQHAELAGQPPGLVTVGQEVAAVRTSPSTGWTIVVRAPTAIQYAALREVLFTVVVTVVGLVLLGVAGLLLVLRPLTGRILVHTRDLQAEVTRLQAVRQTLRTKAARLARANRQLDRLTRSLAHEFQEPLRAMITHGELLRRREALSPEGRDILDWIIRGARRMRDQIEDVRVYLDIGRGVPPRERVDIGAVVDRVMAEFEPVIRASGADVVRGDLPVVIGHPEELYCLFRNLLDNALKYRHPDRPPRIRISAERQGNGWTFRVTDNGIGIPPTLAPKAFDIFRRLHAGDSTGTGMGLAICRRVVEHHGGDIATDSAEDGGTSVIFHLPNRRQPV